MARQKDSPDSSKGTSLSPPTLVGPRPRRPAVHATERWAEAVACVLRLDADVRTLGDWADAVCLSPSALKARCQAAGVRAKASLDLARLLRALTLSRSEGWTASSLLDTIDPRTQRRLFRTAQIATARPGNSPTIDLAEFTWRQRFVTDELPRRILCDALGLANAAATTHVTTVGATAFVDLQ